MKVRESLISAHHNYLVNQMLTPGFVLGDPDSEDDFFFVGDVLRPPGSEPRVSGRLFDERGILILQFAGEEILANPGGCIRQNLAGGFKIIRASGEPLLLVRTEAFANGHLTRIQAKLFDRGGSIRVEPLYDSVRLIGEELSFFSAPLSSRLPA